MGEPPCDPFRWDPAAPCGRFYWLAHAAGRLVVTLKYKGIGMDATMVIGDTYVATSVARLDQAPPSSR